MEYTNNKEYKLLRPLPNKVVGQKVRVDDLNSILNMKTHNVQALVEGGWIEEWKEPKSKVTLVDSRNYLFGNVKVLIKAESKDIDNVKLILNSIEQSVKDHPNIYLTRIDLKR